MTNAAARQGLLTLSSVVDVSDLRGESFEKIKLDADTKILH